MAQHLPYFAKKNAAAFAFLPRIAFEIRIFDMIERKIGDRSPILILKMQFLGKNPKI